MFIAGIHKFDRVRGEGWLDCPACHEHAAQDVVDEMRFLGLSFYRFTPVGRRRVLRCRRCGHRRDATPEELGSLHTSGRRVARAWLVPMGMIPFLVAAIVVVSITLRSTTTQAGVSYVTRNAQPVAPVEVSLPAGYNHSAIKPEDPAVDPGLFTASSGTFVIRLRRYPVNETPKQLMADHFDADVGLLANDFPDKPPDGKTEDLAGTKAYHVTIKYLQNGQDAILDLYALNHDGVSYLLSFQELTSSGIAEAADVGPQVLSSLTFTNKETPAPSPSPSGSPSAGASPSPSPSPSASAKP